jgi:hypothetical protein
MGNQQIHNRLVKEQVVAILENYLAKEISAKEAMDSLGLKKTQFFFLAAKYKNGIKDFEIGYRRDGTTRKISHRVEKAILEELKAEKKLIDNQDLPIRHYNYSAIKDDLEKKKIIVSLPTIIVRAKANDFYQARVFKKIHDREVLTNLAGELVQHDSSHHLWSPLMDQKLYLITTIDDYSRLILYAEFVEQENVWAHILALKSVFLRYGCPLKYYSDQHAIFRYVKDRDKHRPWNNYTKFTDDVDPQWKQILNECKVSAVYALSPQAKGKVERPYRWLQERIVRMAVKQNIKNIAGLRIILKELINTYNAKWVHSTTKEIPIVRFENAIRQNKSLFKIFKPESSEQTIDDIFCLRMQRVVDSYRKISLDGLELRVPNGAPRQTVDLKLIPDIEKGLIKIRLWQENIFLGEVLEKLKNLPIVRF